jgi:tight adherence protein B
MNNIGRFSVLLIKIFFGLCPFLFFGIWLIRRDQKRQIVYHRLSWAKSRDRAPSILNRVNFQNLKKTENKIALLALFLSLGLAFLINMPFWALILQFMVSAPLAWFIVRRYRINRLRKKFYSRFPDAIDSLTRAIQAGVPVERALASLGEIYEGEIGNRFRSLVQHLELGVSFRQALTMFSADLEIADVDFFCAILALNRESGSRLTPMLISLSQTLRDRRAVDRRLQALTSESRGAARILTILPIFILGLQTFLNPAQMRFMLEDPTGRSVLGYCAISMSIGLLIIRRMSRLLED